VAHQRVEAGALDGAGLQAAAAQQLGDEEGEVLAAGAQGGEGHADDGEAVVEVGAEGSVGDLGDEVVARGGEEAHVGGALVVGADGAHPAGLDGAQQAGLDGRGDAAELVEEEGSAVGADEGSGAGGARTGEGALHVPEELALEEGLREGAAVDGDEGLVAPRGEVVDGAGGELLAGSGLAFEEHGDVAVGGELEHGEGLAHHQALAHQLAAAARARGGDLQRAGDGDDAHEAAAELERGPERDAGLVDVGALVEGAVGGVVVGEGEAPGGGPHGDVAAGDAVVGEAELAGGVGADGDGAVGERERGGPARVGAFDDDELTAGRDGESRERLAVDGGRRVAHGMGVGYAL
jgi:hypothetical protein